MATPIIALDAGHGFNTPGKRTPDGIREWTLNDKVRDKAATYLAAYDCDIIYPDNNEGSVDESLASRLNMYIVADADAMVSIHHNAFKGVWGNHTGVCTYTDIKYTAADMRLAQCIQKRHPSYVGLRDRGISKENWYVINQNTIPAVLTEGGFMDSTVDYPVITSDKGQDGYARAIAEGLVEFLGLTKRQDSGAAAPSMQPTNVSDVLYKVQCGAFSKKAGAEEVATKLKKAGFSTYITFIDELYKVQCGAFAKKASAEKLMTDLKNAGFDAFITKTGSAANTPSVAKPTIKVGSTVRVNNGAKTYDGKSLASFVYSRNHKVHSINGDRVVITYNGTVVAAMHKSNLTLV